MAPANIATTNSRKLMGTAHHEDTKDTKRCDLRGLRDFVMKRLWETSQRQKKIESGAAENVLGGRHGGVRVARAALGVNHLDVGRGPGAEADVDDVHHLLPLIGSRPRACEAALAARDRLARGTHLRRRLCDGAGQIRLRDVERRPTL